ncbi:hypothetical protein TNCV_4991511 [Trichonephila clavipes]|nr:hypothetical protein TNCV_4991511 [Trichonephila clavipes]
MMCCSIFRSELIAIDTGLKEVLSIPGSNIIWILSDSRSAIQYLSNWHKFRVYTTPDQVNLTTYALNFGSRVLEYFEKYFGIDYPLPKQGKFVFSLF